MFLNHFLHIFNKKSNKSSVDTERQTKSLNVATAPLPQNTTTTEEDEQEVITKNHSETPAVSVVSKRTTTLPEVEFEESRTLLQLDFFSDNNSIKDQTTTFPKFDYLLQQHEEEKKDNTIKKRKLSTTLRHRLSHYRPANKSMKRTLSTPDLSHNK